MRLFSWLAAHRTVNLAIVVIYFVAVVLPHEIFGAWIHKTFFPGTIQGYDLTFILIILAFLAPVLFVFIKNILRSGRSGLYDLISFLATIIFIIIAYKTILVLATELIHIIQYAVLSFLLLPVVKRYGEAIFWAMILGAIDEGWQYFYLAADNAYFDFNDVIINVLGAAMGLSFLRTFQLPIAAKPVKLNLLPSVWTTGALIILTGALLLFGILQIYPSVDSVAPVILFREVPDHFWSPFHHKLYHVVSPGEAVFILIWLFTFYRVIWDCGTLPTARSQRSRPR